MKRILFILCIAALFTGCSASHNDSSAGTDALTESQLEAEESIDADQAGKILYEKLHVDEIGYHLCYEGTDNFEQRGCYLFRLYGDDSDHRVTLGWYAVDMRTGECFDTNVLTELTPLGGDHDRCGQLAGCV